MNRRQVIHSLTALSGHAMFPSVLGSFLASCAGKEMTGYAPDFFSPADFETITEIIDVIIPATGTKSASAVNVQVFLDQVFAQCLTAEEQTGIKAGLPGLISVFKTTKDKLQYITELDKKAFADDAGAAYFRTIKKYTMIGFFTSQEGETKAGNYVKIPGDYKGEIPIDNNTLNYGKTFLHY